MTLIFVFAVVIFFFSLVSQRIEKSIITGPMVFTVIGLLFGLSNTTDGPLALNMKTVILISEIALALVLFTDATRIRVRELIKGATLPARLLGIGMPLTIILGTILAMLIFTELDIWEAAILATILAPTDAGLGHAIMSSPLVPTRIRQSLNVEAGLNDGISLPFLMLFISLARVDVPKQDLSWITYAAQQIGFGLLLGLAFGWVGGWLMNQANRRHWMTSASQQMVLLTMAVLSWGITDRVGGNGFIAVFVAGLIVKRIFEEAGEEMIHFGEAWGQLFNYFVFFIFGLLIDQDMKLFQGKSFVYAILSLTLARMLPVGISLMRGRFHISTNLFLGWFGPRGLASIVLGMIFIKQQASIDGQIIIETAVAATVILSIFAHGISANPGISLYARQVRKLPESAPELKETKMEALTRP